MSKRLTVRWETAGRFSFDLAAPDRDERPVTILPTRPMLLLRHGETLPRHAALGELVTVPAWILAQLEAGDWRQVEA